MLKKSRITPSWLILILDLVCAGVAMLFALLLRLNFDLEAFTLYPLGNIFCITVGVTLVFSLLLRSYKGIIRYTSITDVGRLSCLSLACALIYYNINWFRLLNQHKSIFPTSVIVIDFYVAIFIWLSYRLAAKWFFRFYWRRNSENKIRAAVYNTSHAGMMVRKLISENTDATVRVVAFLENINQLAGKHLEGLPIYSACKASLERLAKHERIKLLIIADDSIEPALLNGLLDICVSLNIRVQKVPPVDQWINNGWNNTQLKDINIEDLLERSVINIQNQYVSKELKGRYVLVTGAAGSIGSELVRQLIKHAPATVILCDSAESPLHELELEIAETTQDVTVIPFIGNVCDRQRMQQLFEIYAPSIVYHAAAYKHVPMMEKNPSVAVINNVMGTKTLAELSVAYDVEKFIMVSTDKAVNPTNVMGASKRIAEIFTQSYNRYLHDNYGKSAGKSQAPPTRFITTRFGNVLGSNGSVIPRFKKQLEHGGPLTVTHPEITRYFMTIPEACQLVLEAGAMGRGGEIFVFDMGRPVKIADLAEKMIRMSGREPGKDIQITYTGLRPGEKLYEELLSTAENTMPTYHEKIMIASVREYDFIEVKETIVQLINTAYKHYITPTVALMKKLVPEFISRNSAFEQLDEEKVIM
ncbi:MAG TPA: nucleoside-diphosphate sugar epimerase/dehydratase [Chitinophaga sp.]|uniref:polysaccharide biosynthesis protein n=1 Tax=Chitinophaga sp. TaxID=1869181 RepID=UPI002DB77FDC|nr:nucleoside-diphosphate sugar epimerase/dehydratase [Chitinophaga sp.]HEU4553565.1 nucleoside-diphosphate sugar epimerase/dehydratase [Chitinophaga sp.]